VKRLPFDLHIQWTIGLLFGLFWLVSALLPAAVAVATEPESAAAHPNLPIAAWSQIHETGREIFFSRYQSSGWGQALQLSDNGKRNFLPAVISENDGTVWVFWTSEANNQFTLQYVRIRDEVSFAPETIPTQLEQNMAPSALVDRDGTVWLAWSSFDGTDDDIFYSVWEGSRWSHPLRLNTDDYTPDMQPLLGMDADGSPWILWRGFDDGRYRFYFSRWNGADWDPEEALETDSSYLEQVRQQFASLPDLPEEIADKKKCALHMVEAPVQSLPLFMEDFLSEPSSESPNKASPQ